MATSAPPPPRPPTGTPAGGKGAADRGYKRSWKNLLINKRYQLRFTLFMVGLSAALMGGLGWWVMRVANETTTIGIAGARGEPCPKVPSLHPGTPAADDDDPLAPVPMALPAAGSDAVPVPPAPPAAAGRDDDKRPHAHVVLDESSLTVVPSPPRPAVKVVPANFEDLIVTHWQCQMAATATIDDLKLGRLRILIVMISVGLALIIGLAIYGIKMTHKVAGPLFKVTLYFNKMRDGRFDRVWNLRKGDQLIEFYENFKAAHAGVVTLERADIERIRAVVNAADAAGMGNSEIVGELRAMLSRKEKSLE